MALSPVDRTDSTARSTARTEVVVRRICRHFKSRESTVNSCMISSRRTFARSIATYVNESRATISPVGRDDPPSGSMVNANAVESPRSRTMAVVDGSMVGIIPADFGP
jgi:hypothetical protein